MLLDDPPADVPPVFLVLFEVLPPVEELTDESLLDVLPPTEVLLELLPPLDEPSLLFDPPCPFVVLLVLELPPTDERVLDVVPEELPPLPWFGSGSIFDAAGLHPAISSRIQD